MLSKIKTCILQGLDGYIVDVETYLSKGLPSFSIVGLPDASIKEAKERVRAAIKNSGFEFPLNRITVNLAPANLKKEGSLIDLSIALGILIANKNINNSETKKMCFIGELSLDGNINKIDGALPIIISLRKKGVENVIIPFDNKDECCVVDGINIIPVRNLNDLVMYLNNNMLIEPYKIDSKKYFDYENEHTEDFSDIKGQNILKRAMEVAAAGGHNLLIIGPPGSGKTMISKRLPTILPKLSFEEALEVTKIFSISGLLKDTPLITNRPFRAPHHTTSKISMVGGGRVPLPGEVSLAHYGVLFLDELPEFSKNVLEVLRQPMEDGIVTISRANGKATYPSKFMLIASMNPCPCGYFGDQNHECNCTQRSIDNYLGKISGPLLDRIDIHMEVTPVKYEDLQIEEVSTESSENVRERVNKAREIQNLRYKSLNIFSNSELSGRYIKKFCSLNDDSKKLLKEAFNSLGLSARAYNKILKVSRTIADLDGKDDIEINHLAESIQYRSLDKKFWA